MVRKIFTELWRKMDDNSDKFNKDTKNIIIEEQKIIE